MPHLSPAQARLQDDLRGLIDGDVRCDRVALSLYADDASIFAARPLGVVWPRSTEDVVACVQYAGEKRIPIHARGAGTGCAGGAIGRGIVLDFTRHMRRLIRFGDDSVTVQPGAARIRVNTRLIEKQNRIFGPDPGYIPTATFGGIFASDGAGSRWLRYGAPRDYLLGLTVVLPDGEVLQIKHDTLPTASEEAATDLERRSTGTHRRGATEGPTYSSPDESLARKVAMARGIVHGRGHQLADELCRIFAALPRAMIENHRRLPVDNCGYRLDGVLQKGKRHLRIDIPRLLCGSEGTLGIVTEMRWRTVEQPRHMGSVILAFASLEKAARAVEHLLPFRPTLCELVDRRRITLLCEWDRRFVSLISPSTEAALLVEVDDAYPLALTERLNDMLHTLYQEKSLNFTSRVLLAPEERMLFLELLDKADLALFRMKRTMAPMPMLDDLAVPASELGPTLPAVQNILKRHEVTASFSGHIGHGHLCVSPILDRDDPEMIGRLKQIVEDINDEVLRCGGTLTSEQVAGIARSRFVVKQYPEHYSTFVKIKNLFDPGRIFNPGKVVGDGLPWTSHLRPFLQGHHSTEDTTYGFFSSILAPDSSSLRSGSTGNANAGPIASLGTRSGESGNSGDFAEERLDATPPDFQEQQSQLEYQLKWAPERFADTALRCNGCGRCRTRREKVRMCPVFHVLASEAAAPRSKANLMCDVLEGTLPLDTLTSEGAKRVADHCIHCHACRIECPAEVDIPHLAFRCKSAFVAAHGMSFGDRLLSNIDPVCRVLTWISCPLNWSLRNKTMRWIYEKTFGIPQGRKLPVLNKVTFLTRTKWTKRHARPTREPGRKVALFLDTFANLFDVKLAEAAVKVLRHNGIGIYIPTRQRCSGDAAFACGDQYHTELLARRNIAVFADAVRQGYEVVTLETSSVVALTREYRYLSDDPDAVLISEHTVDLCGYLDRLRQSGELVLPTEPIEQSVGYHAPCRSLAAAGSMSDTTAAESLLRLIPGLEVRRLDKGCCGMARTYGMKAAHYSTSLRIGMELFKALRDEKIDIGATECTACKLQMENAVEKATLHPIKLLAEAYGEVEVT